MLTLVDISQWNGIVDFGQLKAQGVTGVYVKISQGVNSFDKNVKANAVGARLANMGLGYYHFATTNISNVVADATAEALDVFNQTKGLPAPTMKSVLDIETNDIKLTPQDCLTWIRTYVAVRKNQGFDTRLYSGLSWLNTNLPIGHELGYLSLWLAEYNNWSSPQLPHGWNDWDIWQYSATGKLNGIQGNVDLNRSKVQV